MSCFLYVTYQQTLCSSRQLMAGALVVPVSKGLEFLSSSNWCSWGGGEGGFTLVLFLIHHQTAVQERAGAVVQPARWVEPLPS